jgi:NADPH-dependent 2,4-dienoyl-CoA reductase/sulfur reductase-like enzyme
LKQADVVIVGGSAAGPVAGVTVKRHYKDLSVLLIRKEREARVMVPCGIPYIFGTIGSADKNVIPDALLANNGIELMIDEVTDIDRQSNTLKTAGGETVSYKKLILAVGSLPIRIPIPGMERENVFTVRKDADYLAEIQSKISQAKDIVVIGGGFIGVEMADECFKKDSPNVTIVEILPHCLMLVLDPEFYHKAEEKLKERGIRLLTNDRVTEILGDGKANAVALGSGNKLKADVVIFGIGAAPNTELAQKIGLKLGEMKGIEVDEYQRTSDENIFAIGDCADKKSFFTGKPSNVRLASIATNEARIAGANVKELKRKNPGAIGVFATALGDFAVAAAGLTEKAAYKEGYDIIVTEVAAPDKHPGCMPNACEQKVKLVFDGKSKKLLGGQVYGGASTAELANVIAMAIQNGMTADDVAMFQMGTHPALTASPIAYQLVNAAEMALAKM